MGIQLQTLLRQLDAAEVLLSVATWLKWIRDDALDERPALPIGAGAQRRDPAPRADRLSP